MKPTYAGKRVDATAKALTAHAKALGLGVVTLGGVVDAVLYLHTVVRIVDWKTPGEAALTEGQGKLIAQGCPVHFIGTPEALELLAAEMRREALR